ncbi:MAG: hypothetical protein Q9195_005966 [Heterodermia aff. obscurata]
MGDEFPFVFNETGTSCPEHVVCHFQYLLKYIINSENFRFFLHEKDLNNLRFERWRNSSNIASWADDPYQECDSLPDTTVRQWNRNVQTSMTTGLADLANDVFYVGVLRDGPKTTLTHDPLPRSLKQFLNNRYKDIKAEPQKKIYPVFVNVSCGKFNEETFTNDDNAAVCLTLLTDLLRASIVSGADVGIIAVYAGQVKIYGRALAALDAQNPGCGYADVRVGTVEWWSSRTAEVVVFDMVGLGTGRTSYLNQRIRLQIALTTHRHGLVVIGSKQYLYDNLRALMEISDQAPWDAMLNAVLLWFMNADRVTTVRLRPYSILSTIWARPPLEEMKRTAQEQNMSSTPSKKRVRIHSGSNEHDGLTQEHDMSSTPSKKRVRIHPNSKQHDGPKMPCPAQ